MTAPENVASLAEQFADLSDAARDELLGTLSADHLEQLSYDWRFWARSGQLVPPGDWFCWLVLAGRGFGKTRMGAEWIRQKALETPSRIALVADTAGEARSIMVEGDSGLLAISPNGERPIFEPSKQKLSWPNGSIATLYSADDPEQLRGPQHAVAWVDELAKFRHSETLWANLLMGLRLGKAPQVMVTTTPRPLPLLKKLMAEEATQVTRGATWANARNLAPQFIAQMKARYAGTSLGAQELEGAVLETPEGALWRFDQIAAHRVKQVPDLDRIVVAVDPPVTAHEGSDECGIIVAGCIGGEAYILADESLHKAPPDAWARAALDAYEKFAADRLIAEVNQGGDLVESLMRAHNAQVSYRAVRASRGKSVRAEPIVALYEQGRVHHVGVFDKLEAQLTSYVPGAGKSPDRLDALVWALTDLMLGRAAQPAVRRL